MSKILYVGLRDTEISKTHEDKIKKVCDAIAPDNIRPNKTRIAHHHKTIVGISNPVQNIKINGTNVLLGNSFGGDRAWDKVKGGYPDGNYAIFRCNENEIEIVSDILGTRAIWYYHDKNTFIASTSQRAIIKYLGDFKFDEEVIPWMLSNGVLGPGLSWDKRISLLPPDSSLVLDRGNWSYGVDTKEIEFAPNTNSDKENIEALHETLQSTFSELDLDYSQWNLTLSGGYDSRGNLCLLPKKDNKGIALQTVTWGMKESENTKGSDAYVAKKLSKKHQLPHTFFHTDSPDEPLETILDRFLKNGEGRIDHIRGYMDGFKIWKTLFENKITGVIRGDEVFGSYNFVSDYHVRDFVGLSVLSDYHNLKKFPYLKSLSQNPVGKSIRKQNESFEVWRDRLYQSLYVPIILSSLADLKQAYIEQINPLLSKKIVALIREMPDHLRTDKKAFKQIIDSITNIGFATSSGGNSTKNIFKEEKMVNIIRAELESPLARAIFPEGFLSSLLSQMVMAKNKKSNNKRMMAKLKAMIPKSIKRKILKQTFIPMMDMNVLAFRVFLIVRMVRIFKNGVKSKALRQCSLIVNFYLL